jgi:alpha-methylacyl-CoA racemase
VSGTPPLTGALSGHRVIELAGIGPAPFAGMMLADMGAEVIRIDRAEPAAEDLNGSTDPLQRGRRSIALDLKDPAAVEIALKLIATADILIEGFRPGVMERLGLGPEPCLRRAPKLVYGRMTGWGQAGPNAARAGHDINYLAVSGALAAIGRHGAPPTPPLNLVGDFGGGGMLLTVGVLAGLVAASATGTGQVIDAAMVDGAALLLASVIGLYADGRWSLDRGTNLIDSGAPFYDTYETSDGRYVAVGAIEQRFYEQLLAGCGIENRWPDRMDVHVWPEIRQQLAKAFLAKSRDEWCEAFSGSDGCVTPVLTMAEVAGDPHIAARGTYAVTDGVPHPAAAPRFSRTPSQAAPGPNVTPGQHTNQILAELGYDEGACRQLIAAGTARGCGQGPAPDRSRASA